MIVKEGKNLFVILQNLINKYPVYARNFKFVNMNNRLFTIFK